jgi:hypothetical protein
MCHKYDHHCPTVRHHLTTGYITVVSCIVREGANAIAASSIRFRPHCTLPCRIPIHTEMPVYARGQPGLVKRRHLRKSRVAQYVKLSDVASWLMDILSPCKKPHMAAGGDKWTLHDRTGVRPRHVCYCVITTLDVFCACRVAYVCP